jgi:MoxR-like ATPase
MTTASKLIGPRAQQQMAFISALLKITGNNTIANRDQVLAAAKAAKTPNPAWLTNNPEHSAGRGLYRIPADKLKLLGRNSVGDKSWTDKTPATTASAAVATPAASPSVVMRSAAGSNSLVAASFDAALGLTGISENGNAVPAKDSLFVPYGHFDVVKKIIASQRWAPSYMVGPSGCGKTYAYQQACAQLKREYFEVQITTETTEDDLLGGFRLIGGETKFVYGPVTLAMQRGGFLVLDEIDQATNKIMCLQQVLNGKAVFLKKINQWVHPIAGFNVGATANTKGNGDDTGRFVGANPLNVAFRDRLSGMTFVADYPTATVELKILTKAMEAAECKDLQFAEHLVAWAGVIRKTNKEGGLDETMTTRRLVQIAQNLAILDDRMTCVELGINIYDEITRDAMVSLYKVVDEAANAAPAAAADMGKAPVDATTTKCPF